MKYPSVTKVLDATMPNEKRAALDAWKLRVGEVEANRIRDAAFARGRQIDAYVDVWRQTGTCEDERIANHLSGYTFRYHEFTVVSEQHKYQGRLDAILSINDRNILVDFKGSSKVNPRYLGDYELQIGAYFGACREMGIHIDMGCVCLFEDGKPKPYLHWINPEGLEKSFNLFTLRRKQYELQGDQKPAQASA